MPHHKLVLVSVLVTQLGYSDFFMAEDAGQIRENLMWMIRGTFVSITPRKMILQYKTTIKATLWTKKNDLSCRMAVTEERPFLYYKRV